MKGGQSSAAGVREDTLDRAMALIDRAKKTFGEAQLFGGNCGTFALALVTALDDPAVRLGVAYRGEDTEQPKDILDSETDVYHVWVEIGETLVDGSGQMDHRRLLDWVGQEYQDGKPGLLMDADPKDVNLGRLIRQDTYWDVTQDVFQEGIQTALSSKRRRVRPT